MSSKSLPLMLASLTLSACVSTTPNWDSQFGQSVRGAVANQTINPAAAANQDPVAGIDAKAALGAQKRYEQSFAQPEAQTPSILINLPGK
ncbi:hypothetical protein [Massilia sp. S19_KUP03_FR1]|uniref:hypothetical protein n=1 Tax=Massilia sp. S19_KUP03_FR1 TaxID=3025503 RepID=UPI002FCD9FEE